MNGLKYLLNTFNIFAYNKGSYKEELKSKISSLYGSENVYTTLNGRTAIYLFLKSLSLSSGSQVAVQAFTCNAVINPILANNLEPLYIDITEGSYNMSLEDLNEKITDNTKVLILQHTFGVLADKRIIDFCKQRGIWVLEDCAHTLGNTDVGNWGDATMLSFGIEKMLPTRVGGALIVNNPELIAGVVGKYSEIKSISKWESFKWMINPMLWRCIRLVPEPFTSGVVWILKRIGLLKSGFSVSENQGARLNLTVKDITQVLARVAVDCLASINILLSHRKQLTELYSRELGLNLSGPLVRYPYVPESKEYVDRLIRSIAQLGYPFYDKWFCPVVFPKATNLQKMKYIKGSCPVAEKTSEMIVNLPTGLNVSESKAMDIVNLIKSQKQL